MRKLAIALISLLILALVIGSLGCAKPKLVTELVYEADLSTVVGSVDEAIQESINIMKRRLDALDVKGAHIEREGANRIVVQLPDVEDLELVADFISQTAQLNFRELTPESWQVVQDSTAQGNFTGYQSFIERGLIEWIPAMAIDSEGEEVHLTGKYLRSNTRVTGEAEVVFEFKSEGADMFAQITSRLIGRPLAIFLDDLYISSPIVQSRIEGGRGIIENIDFTEARALASLLNEGAIPCRLEVVSINELP